MNMAKGMKDGLRPEIKKPTVHIQQESKIKNIKIISPDLGALLVDFLGEILYLIQTNKEIYYNINFKKLSDTELEGELIGQKVERFGEDIKAVTYHGLDIHQGRDGIWEATVLFDI